MNENEAIEIGIVTSGSPSPTLNQNIAMGYVARTYSKPGTNVEIQVRGRGRKAVVTKMPFVPSKYFK
jgi:aminomethyltransferase